MPIKLSSATSLETVNRLFTQQSNDGKEMGDVLEAVTEGYEHSWANTALAVLPCFVGFLIAPFIVGLYRFCNQRDKKQDAFLIIEAMLRMEKGTQEITVGNFKINIAENQTTITALTGRSEGQPLSYVIGKPIDEILERFRTYIQAAALVESAPKEILKLDRLLTQKELQNTKVELTRSKTTLDDRLVNVVTNDGLKTTLDNRLVNVVTNDGLETVLENKLADVVRAAVLRRTLEDRLEHVVTGDRLETVLENKLAGVVTNERLQKAVEIENEKLEKFEQSAKQREEELNRREKALASKEEEFGQRIEQAKQELIDFNQSLTKVLREEQGKLSGKMLKDFVNLAETKKNNDSFLIAQSKVIVNNEPKTEVKNDNSSVIIVEPKVRARSNSEPESPSKDKLSRNKAVLNSRPSAPKFRFDLQKNRIVAFNPNVIIPNENQGVGATTADFDSPQKP